MVLTPSAAPSLGTQAPDFQLPDVASGQKLTRDAIAAPQGLLVFFICRHCPYVKHVQQELARIGRDYASRGIGIVAISANDATQFPEDAPESLKEQAHEIAFTFPYLYDETQAVAHAFGAVCTPDIFLYDGEQRLVYRGQLDDSRPSNGKPVTGAHLRAALDALIAAQPVPQRPPSVGCSIKWKPTA